MGRVEDLQNMIKERRVGFQIEELMSGEHEFETGMGPEGKYPFEFKVKWGPKNISAWLNPKSEEFLTQPLWGTVTAGGLCYDAPCEGTLELAYFSERKIRYTFDFQAYAKEYHFVGEKVNILPWNLPVSHTTCFGTVTEKDTGKLVSRSVTYFKWWTAPFFIASFRLA